MSPEDDTHTRIRVNTSTKPSAKTWVSAEQSRMDRIVTAAAITRRNEFLVRVSEASWRACEELAEYCPCCWVLGGDKVKKNHKVGGECIMMTGYAGELEDIGGEPSWVMRKYMQPKKGETPHNFCYGCHMVLGKFGAHREATTGPKCPLGEIINVVMWTMFRVPEMRKMILEDFMKTSKEPSIYEFGEWLGKGNDRFFTNYMQIFLEMCVYRGMNYCRL